MAKKMSETDQAQYDMAAEMLNKMPSVGEVARFIARAWPNVWFGAVPYLQAMASGTSFEPGESYIAEDQKTMVLYFLANAQTWKGPVAKATKDFLKAKYKIGGR
jgi:hypothetical protein